MQAELGSGIRHMSDSLIAFQPAIEEPSDRWPSENVSSSIIEMSKVTCCHLPRGSVNRKSAYLTSLSLISFRTSWAVVIGDGSLLGKTECSALPGRAKSRPARPRSGETRGPLRMSILLHGLAVQRDVETFALDFGGDAQADDEVDDLEDDQRDDGVIDDDDDHALDLVEHLGRIALDEAGGSTILLDREHAGEDCAGGRAHAADA